MSARDIRPKRKWNGAWGRLCAAALVPRGLWAWPGTPLVGGHSHVTRAETGRMPCAGLAFFCCRAPFCLHLDKPRPASWVIGQGWSLADVMFTARPASAPLGTKPAANLRTRWFGQAGPSFCSAGTNDGCSLLKATFGGALFNGDARQWDTERAWRLPCLQC